MSSKQCKRYSAAILNILNEEQLKDILRSELLSDETNVELIKKVNDVLRSKSTKKVDCNIDSAWQDFIKEGLTSELLYADELSINNNQVSKSDATKKRSRFHIAIAAAIIVMLLINGTFTANALGYDLWDVIVNWTNETFGFISREHSNQGNDSVSQLDFMDEFISIQSSLEDYGITEKVIPTYVPDEFERSYAKIDDSTENTAFIYMYSNDNRSIILRYVIFSTTLGSSFQKDEGEPEIYEASGVEHYIATNVGKYIAIWTRGNLECSISGLDSRGELIKMIDSIYK